MKLTSKYKKAANNVGQCPALLNSRQFILLSVKPTTHRCAGLVLLEQALCHFQTCKRINALDVCDKNTLHQHGESESHFVPYWCELKRPDHFSIHSHSLMPPCLPGGAGVRTEI
jgi:hypothetical protein